MENLIREVIELDKKKRNEIEVLQNEKSKIAAYVRGKRDEIEKKYKEEADEIHSRRKKEIDKSISEAKAKAKDRYEISIKEIEMFFNKHRQEWLDSLYEYCVDFDVEDE